MILRDRSRYGAPLADRTTAVSCPKSGRQFDAIELDADDVAELVQLTPQKLQDWLAYWQCGFRPRRA